CLQIRDFRRFLEVVFGHLPINLQGYNYGLTYFAYPWLGSLAMFVFCFSLGVLLSWVMEKTNSIWAPALLHGAVNAIVGVGLLFQLPTEKALALRILGPTPTGLLAVLPFLCLALAILQKEKRETHEFY
ncbi:CPBP family intramembrane glutamic endopeptidase, partial [Streptococcus anginosus]|uniref:CPBP family intramembrane glutamic endopeptidase n=2 Tax=Streptococcus TaxID=1301 RepID=UPI0018AC1F3C